jgi:hypothetical protein
MNKGQQVRAICEVINTFFRDLFFDVSQQTLTRRLLNGVALRAFVNVMLISLHTATKQVCF